MRGLILNYHRISLKRKESIYSTYLEDFKRHIEILKKRGYIFIDLDTFYREEILPEKWVILSFDDGYESCSSLVRPVLEENNIRGHFFIVVNFTGRDGFMDWQILRELSHRHIIGSHGLTHRIFKFLSPQDLQKEILISKEIISKEIGKETFYFSLPRGILTKTTRNVLKNSGYRFCLTSVYDSVERKEFLLPRIIIISRYTLEDFERMISLKGAFFLREKYLWRFKAIIRFSFPQGYEYVRKRLYKVEY